MQRLGIEIPTELASGMRTRQELLDHISARLTTDSLRNNVYLQAIGGKRLREQGAEMVADSSTWGAVGIVQSARVSPRVIAGYTRAKREIKRGRPGLFIPIDFGFINIKLALFARSNGWKVLYFIPPGSWRKNKQGADLPMATDAIVTPFPWSAEILNKMGANAHYFGHPLKEMVAQTPDANERSGIAVLPGSRAHEIESNVAVIALAIKDMPGPVRIALAPTADERFVKNFWTKWSDDEPVIVHSAAEALKASRSAVVCSGTATLEAALCGCPCVVMYRGDWVMEIEFRVRKPKFDYISLPNILLDRPLLKELLRQDATPEAVRTELESLHADGQRRSEVLAAFRKLSDSLGDTDCLERTAELAKSMLAE
jgi:lipid-A-disaccharide synthase